MGFVVDELAMGEVCVLSTSVLPYQYHSTSAPYSFNHISPISHNHSNCQHYKLMHFRNDNHYYYHGGRVGGGQEKQCTIYLLMPTHHSLLRLLLNQTIART